jgi:type IV fimbrial biogenesis protein FimT
MDMTTALRQPPRNSRGFTLLELMVTVAIAIILMTVAFPSFRSFMDGQRIKTASFDIIAMLTLARSEAVKRNAQITATPTNNDWGQGWLVTAQQGTNTVILSQQSSMSSSSITITCLQGTPLTPQTCAPIVYDYSGRLAAGSAAQSIQILSSAMATGPTNPNSRCISIDLSGRPMSKKGTC